MSKYDALWKWIGENGTDSFRLTYAEIEKIAGLPLDHSFLKFKKELVDYGYEVVKISMKEQNELADKYIEMLQVKTASRETLIKQLSGGNQQKVILGRWLATDPDFLILDEPTRGIDIGTKTEIQKLVLKLAEEGKGVIFISSEIEEMLRTCTKMAVLRDGMKVGEITESLTQESVMKAIAGGDTDEQ